MALDHAMPFDEKLTYNDLFDANGHFTNQLIAILIDRVPENEYAAANVTFTLAMSHCEGCAECRARLINTNTAYSFMKQNPDDDLLHEAVDFVDEDRALAKQNIQSLMWSKKLTGPEYTLKLE